MVFSFINLLTPSSISLPFHHHQTNLILWWNPLVKPLLDSRHDWRKYDGGGFPAIKLDINLEILLVILIAGEIKTNIIRSDLSCSHSCGGTKLIRSVLYFFSPAKPLSFTSHRIPSSPWQSQTFFYLFNTFT
jgi:hypothetical protein